MKRTLGSGARLKGRGSFPPTGENNPAGGEKNLFLQEGLYGREFFSPIRGKEVEFSPRGGKEVYLQDGLQRGLQILKKRENEEE